MTKKNGVLTQGMAAVKWLTGTKDEFPEIQEFADNFIRNANRVAGFHKYENKVKLKFGYEETHGRFYRLELHLGPHVLYTGYVGSTGTNKQASINAFEFLKERAILELFAKGIEQTMLNRKLRHL